VKKIKVTWMSGTWNADDAATDSAEIPAAAQLNAVGDTLVFKTGDGICLIIPEQRLISAVEIEAQA
jgi:hypothetical protein